MAAGAERRRSRRAVLARGGAPPSPRRRRQAASPRSAPRPRRRQTSPAGRARRAPNHWPTGWPRPHTARRCAAAWRTAPRPACSKRGTGHSIVARAAVCASGTVPQTAVRLVPSLQWGLREAGKETHRGAVCICRATRALGFLRLALHAPARQHRGVAVARLRWLRRLRRLRLRELLEDRTQLVIANQRLQKARPPCVSGCGARCVLLLLSRVCGAQTLSALMSFLLSGFACDAEGLAV